MEQLSNAPQPEIPALGYTPSVRQLPYHEVVDTSGFPLPGIDILTYRAAVAALGDVEGEN